MKILLLISFILTLNSWSWADDDVCSKKTIVFNAHYGKYTSPLLDTWSEASGNLTKLEIKSKEKYSRVELVLKNDQKEVLRSITLSLKNNRTDKFDFMKSINDLKVFPHQLTINLKKSIDTTVCSELVTLIEKDVAGGVLKKP